MLLGPTTKKTDISALTSNPVFTHNSFSFPVALPDAEFAGRVGFVVRIMVGPGESRILGEGEVDLGEVSEVLLDLNKGEARLQVKVFKRSEGSEILVGRMIVQLKLADEIIPTYREPEPEPGSLEALDRPAAKEPRRSAADAIGKASGISLQGVD